MKAIEWDVSKCKNKYLLRAKEREEQPVQYSSVGIRGCHWESASGLYMSHKRASQNKEVCVFVRTRMCIYPIIDTEAIKERYWSLRVKGNLTTFSTKMLYHFFEVGLLNFLRFICPIWSHSEAIHIRYRIADECILYFRNVFFCLPIHKFFQLLD